MITPIGAQVQNFYDNSPFPDYELNRFKSKEDLKAASYPFARILDRSIAADASVIDVGTGTGQLSAFLSLRRQCVWGVDFSERALKKADALKTKLHLRSWHLKNVDILDHKQVGEIGIKFDYVLALGVLHHTGNAYQAFTNTLKLLKPGGFIAIGLYNSYGRILLRLRRLLAKTVFKNNEQVREWFMKMQIQDLNDKERARGWWQDQYCHPHETTHTLGEVLQWFKRNKIEFYQTIPSSTPFDRTALEVAGVWNKVNQIYPYPPIRQLIQISWLWKTHRDGGYWITCGRSRSAS